MSTCATVKLVQSENTSRTCLVCDIGACNALCEQSVAKELDTDRTVCRVQVCQVKRQVCD